jgi:hypothetical protein
MAEAMAFSEYYAKLLVTLKGEQLGQRAVFGGDRDHEG